MKDNIISQTKLWINDVVVGCNFCPFAGREVLRDSIHFKVLENPDDAAVVAGLEELMIKMVDNPDIETSFLVLHGSFDSFQDYLQLLGLCEHFLLKWNYEGIFQLASFHPEYCFAGTDSNDPANYTNRSPHPMLHLLREASITKAAGLFPDMDKIPQININFARQKGLAFMQELRKKSME